MIQHLKQVWQFRYFWASLVRLDLRNRYRRSVLGIGWSLLNPLAMTVVFCIAFGGILGSADWRKFAPYLLGGLAVWEFMRGSVTQGCDAFVRAEAYIRQAPLPLSIYSLRTVLGTFIHFVISLALVVAAVVVLQDTYDVLPRLASVVPAILMLIVFCWSTATLAAFANSYFHDTKHLIDVVAQLLFFLTPIMYNPEVVVNKVGSWVIEYNPAAHFLMLISHPLVQGTEPPAGLFLTTGSLTLGMFGLACCTMAWLQKRVVFQL
jgi:ABC-type polysaccharide/polyol phosphate export permease